MLDLRILLGLPDVLIYISMFCIFIDMYVLFVLQFGLYVRLENLLNMPSSLNKDFIIVIIIITNFEDQHDNN